MADIVRPSLKEWLQRLDRKERAVLLRWAMQSEFLLGDSFRDEVGRSLKLTIPPRAFVAMDYHLDWLFAALALTFSSPRTSPVPRTQDGETAPDIEGNHRDIDLLVVWDSGETTQMLMIEAKGSMGWSNTQLWEKMRRLKLIFRETAPWAPRVSPHFLLASPKESKGIVTNGWPIWATRQDGRPNWIEMGMASDLRRVERCDGIGNASAQGDHWHIVA